ncbi:MAG: TRAP transporter large permease [Eubacteriales bacterium]|jgi:tripartite ATP-independent transporter DctM subunit
MGFIPIAVLGTLFVLNIPVAYCLMLATITYFAFINTTIPLDMVFQRMVASAESFPLLAVPFFITVGNIMNFSGITSRLMKLAELLTGHLVGGLAQVNIVLSVLMAGISGSSNADAAMQCKILVPEMQKRGYDTAFCAVVTATSSVISPIIPPGICLILYAFMANVSIGKMFMAGYIPGLMMMICLMVAAHVISKKRGYLPSRERGPSAAELGKQLLESSWALAMPFGILLGLRFGVFTPTEGGAIACAYTTLVGLFIYKELKPCHFKSIILDSVRSTATVMLIIVAAGAFGFYMSWERLPQRLTEVLVGITDNPYLMLLMINVFLLFIGMFLEGTASMIILVPLLVPVVEALGIDLIHFGIIMCVNLTIGGCTPPFGTMMFLCCSLLKIPVMAYVKESLPFIGALIAALLLCTYIPPLVTFVPNLLMG